jgi:hypothetical protein
MNDVKTYQSSTKVFIIEHSFKLLQFSDALYWQADIVWQVERLIANQ